MARAVVVLTATGVGGALLVTTLLSTAATAPLDNLNLGDVACAIADSKLSPMAGLTGEQSRNAEVIVSVGAKMKVPVRGRVVAVATALQESSLTNKPQGDRDSVGLFQQRPSQGWGTKQQLMDPAYSSSKFYSRLVAVRGWQKMRVTEAAQAVQKSGFPEAYAKHEQQAVQAVAASKSTPGGVQQINSGTGCTPLSTPASVTTKGYVSVAMQQVGKPYKWGGTGPDSFDCSGLIVYAWRQKGYQLKVRTSQQMSSVAVPVRAGRERQGDLIFTQLRSDGPAHVMIVVRPGLAVEAPRTGLDVRVREYDASTEEMTFGRLPASQMTAISAQA
jgi:cell wall-associated NlpC family hydrolase